MGAARTIGVRVDMAWLDRIACAKVPPEAFEINGPLHDHHFQVLALCERCPVRVPCRNFQTNAAANTSGQKARSIIAGGVIVGKVERPHWRELNKWERARYEKWLDETGTKRLLW